MLDLTQITKIFPFSRLFKKKKLSRFHFEISIFSKRENAYNSKTNQLFNPNLFPRVFSWPQLSITTEKSLKILKTA